MPTPPAAQVTLRSLLIDDAAAMTAVLAHPSLYKFIGGHPPTEEQLRRQYAVQVRGSSPDGSERWVNDVILVDGAPGGYVQATIPTAGGPAEIAWVVGQELQGQGVATRASALLMARLREMGIEDVVAHIHPDHQASQRVAQKLGLDRTGVFVDGEERWAGEVGATQVADGSAG